MSIIGTLGNLFGYKGDFAEAFGSSIVESSTSTFADGIDKSLDKFDKQVEEYAKIDLAADLKKGELQQEELKNAVNGIKKYTQLGFSPAIAAAIHVSPVATQKIIVDAANSTEDKTTLDNLWKSSVEINKEMPTISVMDAAKLLVGNQITTTKDYSAIPETKNMLTRLGFNANLKEAIKERVASRPSTVLDLSVDTDATIPTGGPTADALAKAKKLNEATTQPRLKTYADETLKLLPIINQGNKIGASPEQVIAGMEASIALNGIQSTQVDTSGNYIGDAMIKARKRQRYSEKLKTPKNPEGIVIFSNVGFIDGVKKLINIADGDGEGSKTAKAQVEDIISKIREIYGAEATKLFGQLLK